MDYNATEAAAPIHWGVRCRMLAGAVALRATISTPHGKRRYVRQLFATIADRYDLITRVLSYGQDRRWKTRAIALARLTPGDRVLDLACGTGDLMFEAAAQARAVVGVDVTFRMLQLAKVRRSALERESAARCQLVTGDMGTLPVATHSFDVVTTGYGLRNVPDLAAAIDEIHRVLVPGGRLVSLDFNRPSNAAVRSAYWLYLTLVGSALGWCCTVTRTRTGTSLSRSGTTREPGRWRNCFGDVASPT
jgi:demethylmenaquinone methyltransferase/2-methoxy-6-polyprenyl-1,4-benzoquinol methylase